MSVHACVRVWACAFREWVMNLSGSWEQPLPHTSSSSSRVAAVWTERRGSRSSVPSAQTALYLCTLFSGSNLMTEFTPDSRNERAALPIRHQGPRDLWGLFYICPGVELHFWPWAIRCWAENLHRHTHTRTRFAEPNTRKQAASQHTAFHTCWESGSLCKDLFLSLSWNQIINIIICATTRNNNNSNNLKKNDT